MHLKLIIVKLHSLKMSWQQMTSLSRLKRSGPQLHGNCSNLKPALELYADYVDSADIVLAEPELWKRKWTCVSLASTGSDSLPSTAIDPLNACRETIFPNIHTLLKIACTLPVTTSSQNVHFRLSDGLKTTWGQQWVLRDWMGYVYFTFTWGYTLRQMK